MTKLEAKEAINNGEKICHRHFSPDEFVILANDGSGRYETEEGYIINPAIFWSDRRNPTFDTDWEIWSPAFGNGQ
jgi:hypothetical protein